ncbi:hypothetical protein NPIL_568291 [Nephila pilipes]|uniref:Uncharacterized protein n=1 Tax=Nephila pilipes TaxID=299642 RepID=A0A8X6INX1_NEPPI|nr:hypothetical protein NPIL_568291 [Nephila pilipes]
MKASFFKTATFIQFVFGPLKLTVSVIWGLTAAERRAHGSSTTNVATGIGFRTRCDLPELRTVSRFLHQYATTPRCQLRFGKITDHVLSRTNV